MPGTGPHLSDWVEVSFGCVPGSTYDVYVSPSMTSPSWALQGSVVASGSSSTYTDPGPVFAERYYRVGVAGTSPVVYSPNQAGVLPLTVIGREAEDGTQAALFGTSLDSTESPRDIQNVIGWQTDGSTDLATASEIWGWDPESTSYVFAWLFDTGGTTPTFDGCWMDQTTGLPSDMAMPVGSGYWFFNKSVEARTAYFDGLVQGTELGMDVPVDNTKTTSQIMGQPLAADVPLNETGTTLQADGAQGGTDLAIADEIWAWNQATDGYVFAWLFDSAGTTPSWDGKWIDQTTGLETTLVLQRGMGWWYHSKADPARVPGWTWTEPVPY